MKLLIVESPAKCKTIKKYLGTDYEVLASYGHLRNLSDKHYYGIDLKNNFTPHYTNIPGKSKQITQLKNCVKRAETVYLATDDDREGEAIAWHLAMLLKLDIEKTPRIIFHSITKTALLDAIKAPKKLDLDLVHAQQARQVLDKLYGYELSPLLWKHISNKMKLSAGRVQSVVTKLVIDREDQITNFNSVPYFETNGTFNLSNNNLFQISAQLTNKIENIDLMQKFLEKAQASTFKISNLEKTERNCNPPPPFITSTLLQEAGQRLGFSSKQTMMTAQKLYENGFITYMRTDSTMISKGFSEQISAYINEKYGPTYVHTRNYSAKKSKGAQEAHECIRPTNIKKTFLNTMEAKPNEQRLYQIIWQRTVASQMSAQKIEQLKITISLYYNNVDDGVELPEKFQSKFERELFPGYKIIYNRDPELEKEKLNLYQTASTLKVEDNLKYSIITGQSKSTNPPARYTEASLIKDLERKGIGRPSTYASMVSKIQDKNYVVKETRPGKETTCTILQIGNVNESAPFKTTNGVNYYNTKNHSGVEKNKLFPTDIGRIVTSFLVENFSELMDYQFTSEMESKLDLISNGEKVWHQTVKEFYQKFHEKVVVLDNLQSQSQEETCTDGIPTKGNPTLLGKHPVSGENIYVVMAKHGPCIRMGDNPKKADYYSLNGQSFLDITLEDSLKLMEYPRKIGEYGDHVLYIKSGPYGLYFEHGDKKISIKDQIDFNLLKSDQIFALYEKLVEEKSKNNNVLHQFKSKDLGEISVLNGKFGAYIKLKNRNISLKDKNSEQIKNLTLDGVKKIVLETPVAKKSWGGRGSRGRGSRGSRGRGSSGGRGEETKKKLTIIKKKQ